MKEKFTTYFDPNISIKNCGVSLQDILTTVADRYIGQNPAGSFRFRAFREDSFLPGSNGSYNLDLNAKLPEAKMSQSSLIAARFYRSSAGGSTLLIRCYSKTNLFFNGKLLWQSTTYEENNAEKVTSIDLPCNPGWNTVLLCCKKTASGFGCDLGPMMPGWRWISFLSPFEERYGQGGFIYSQSYEEGSLDPASIDLEGREEAAGLSWYPNLDTDKITDPNDLEAVFRHPSGQWGCAWTKLSQSRPGKQKISIDSSLADLYLDGLKMDSPEILVPAGNHNLLMVSRCPERDKWKIRFAAHYEDGTPLEFYNPGVLNAAGPYLYLGPLKKKPDMVLPSFYALYGEEEKCYWRVSRLTAVRPYLENDCFGRWNYPLGVTLYGLTQTSRILKRPDIGAYVGKHMQECLSLHEYSLWDAKIYGYPEINNQIVALNSLDDCGSFGSAMLEFYRDGIGEKEKQVADRIGSYMENGQYRREDGAFYRRGEGHPTMWVDDLYMSIPFLCRYAQLTGDSRYLDDAAKQVLMFKKYLYIPEYKVMSHVYDFQVGTATRVPWGRGNGWSLFSITELLEYMPEDHKDRPEILAFLAGLCEGILSLQGSRGLWHQVLTVPDSYEETSCTAMFIYGFSRAVRFGWVSKALGERLLTSAIKAWDGIESYSIDRSGNIYGICQGSLYSFNSDYYRDVLGWTLNDTHGIGIILLAGIELNQAMQ